ncbi:MAG: ATP-binding protein [Propionibacteriaceae bacterium]|jgi:predicted AAA+ superfamily ATPase|nr:ATP-binding protein [Propionibacteriaceae bacterium]
MRTPSDLIHRHIEDVALERIKDTPVLLLEGPRTVGKSTLLRTLAEHTGGRLVDLDDLDTRTAAIRDPATIIGGPKPLLIDEYQHAPMLLDAIKAQLNRDGNPGQFILTGSARHESLPRTAQALTGRLQRLPVLPLAQAELDRTRPRLLERALTLPHTLVTPAQSSTSREEYIQRVVRGGLPLALASRTDHARHVWIDDYVKLTLERDVQELSRLRQARVLPDLLARLAGQTPGVLNATSLAGPVGIDEKTARDYIRLLEAVFLVHLLPAWDRTLTKRTTVRPKIHLVDTAVASRLLRLTAEKLARREAAAMREFGHLLETFVVNELLREASWSGPVADAGHWRTKDGYEVDLVIEADDGGVVGFEIKSAAQAAGNDFRGLERLRDLLGSAFVAGFVLYTGVRSYTYGDRLHVLPIDRLWTREEVSSTQPDKLAEDLVREG